MRATDDKPTPEAIERMEQEKIDARGAFWAFATSTLLGLVSLYPIIRGTRTDNHTMLLIGFLVALVAFKILPVDKINGLISTWRGK